MNQDVTPAEKPMKGMFSREVMKKLMVLAALVIVVWGAMDRIVVSKGDSVPYTLFWSSPGKVAALGDYVNMTMAHPIIGDEPALLTKRVACDSGQTIAFTGEIFLCDGKRLGGYITRTWDGKPLQPWSHTMVIPEGKAFVMGEHPRSFDSRYLGLVDKSQLTVVRGLL